MEVYASSLNGGCHTGKSNLFEFYKRLRNPIYLIPGTFPFYLFYISIQDTIGFKS